MRFVVEVMQALLLGLAMGFVVEAIAFKPLFSCLPLIGKVENSGLQVSNSNM